ncbi:Adaptive-response sensory-kinase SasA [bioreactor metagenome]|uniref:histidine kinase n=1 Tax=bioreactor metagenome TaxID=1076179 RepID=A0A645CAK7_9ZZZZ
MVFLYTRRFSKPLREIAHTSTSMAAGDFSNRVTEEGTKEIYDMAVAFNTMAGKLSETEQVRRDFIANLSHELRSPMTNIRGFIQGILDGTIPQAESGHYLEIVLNETNRLTKLVTGLLNLSRIENSDMPLEMTSININELIRLVLITKVNQIEQKGLDVRLNFIEEVSTVRCDRDQIEQVLINLIDNAIKFTPNGGVIQITTGYMSSDTLSVTVRDNGIGVLKQDAAYIFDRFYKADKAHASGSGTGLGLSISKMILEKHGQRIELLDSEDGAAFRFTLQRVNGHEGSK